MHRDLLRFEITTHSRWQHELKLLMSLAESTRLADWLDAVLQGRERSVTLPRRITDPLPGEWRVYFKTRGSGSRVLLAHPGNEQWVATVAMESSAFANFLSRLRAGSSGDVESLTQLEGVSNLHLSFDIV